MSIIFMKKSASKPPLARVSDASPRAWVGVIDENNSEFINLAVFIKLLCSKRKLF
ncbi:hypothetical protein [Candidatus Anaplasma sp. TIGMIC]|uniref:hypothetical protein n=1 Tax=Candidatus Anaplasma sp. TIGMIC TaxID=3020713 RepID=UPI00232C3608|nr:hypothetical protein [Candidatus Anaplasma sp. TIGMIC]